MAGFLSSLSPQELDAFLSLGSKAGRATMLEAQRQEVAAGRNRPRRQRSTWAGALAEGLGDTLRDISGGIRENQLTSELGKLQEDISKGNSDYFKSFSRWQNAPEQLIAQEDVPSMGPMAGPEPMPPGPWAQALGPTGLPPPEKTPPLGGALAPNVAAEIANPSPTMAPTPRARPNVLAALRAAADPEIELDRRMKSPSWKAALTATPEGAQIADLYGSYQTTLADPLAKTQPARQALLKALLGRR